MDFLSIDNLIAYPGEDEYMLSATMPAQFPNEIPQMLSILENNNFSSMGWNDKDHFARYLAPLDDQTGMQLDGCDKNPNWSTILNHILRQPPSLPAPDASEEEVEGLLFQNIANHFQVSPDTARIDSPSPTPTSSVQEPTALLPRSKTKSTMKSHRRQSHSCDQCRSSKRACDLPLSIGISSQIPSISCTTCHVRGLECTVKWLASKKSKLRSKKQIRSASDLLDGSDSINSTNPGVAANEVQRIGVTRPQSSSLSTLELDIARQVTARETCLQQFKLYVHICDTLLSTCLLDCMPSGYSLGLAALAPLSHSVHINPHFEKANEWVKTCWESTSSSWSATAVAPRIFLTVSLLDSLFQEKCMEHSRPSASRDDSINEAYKWVAMATASQYVVDRGQSPTKLQSRDLALATRRKAQKAVFNNIAASGSFRHALSLMLFGLVLCPKSDFGDRDLSEEDTAFAIREGIRRLQTLCARAQECVLGLPSDVAANVMELIGAISWLTEMTKAVVIASSNGNISLMNLAQLDRNSDVPQIAGLPSQLSGKGASSSTENERQSIDNSNLSQAKLEESTLMKVRDYKPFDINLEYALGQSGLLGVHLWKSLASLTLAEKSLRTGNFDYEQIHWTYKTTMKHVKMWRATFGTFDDITAVSLGQLPWDIRRKVAFSLNDGDLAVLLFHETAKQLEMSLAQLRPTPEREWLCDILQRDRLARQEQQLMSAIQLSTMASIYQGVSSPGFQGDSALTISVQNIGAHPVSKLINATFSY